MNETVRDVLDGQPVGFHSRSSQPTNKAKGWILTRPEFLAVAKGRRHHSPLMTLQARLRDDVSGGPRFGITVTGRTAPSVERSRIKRRLREAIRLHARCQGADGVDYVVIGRRGLLNAPFEAILSDLAAGVMRVRPKVLSRSADPTSAPSVSNP